MNSTDPSEPQAVAELPRPDVKRVIARNTLWNIAGRTWDAIAALVLTPYIVWRIGLSDYGVWGLSASFTGYIGLLDLGLASGYAKYIAEHAARNDPDRISGVVSTGVFCYAILGAVLLAVGWPGIGFAVDWAGASLEASPRAASDMEFLFRGMLALFVVSNCLAPFSAVQTGLQRMDLSNAIGFFMSLIKVAATVALLETGFGVRGLLWAHAVVLGAFAVSCLVVARRLVPGLHVTPARWNRDDFRSLFSFGWRSQVARLSNIVTFETDVVLIGLLFRDMGLVGLYKVGVELANKVRQIPVMLLAALIPAASDLDARADHERLQRLYVVSTKYLASVTVPLLLMTVALAGPLIRAWMGAGFETSAWVLRIIALGYIANVLQGAGLSIALGRGRADLQMGAGLISMIGNIALTATLFLAIGFWGIPIATSLSLFISFAWFLRVMRSISGESARAVVRKTMLWPVWASVPGFVLCAIVDGLTMEMAGRVPNGLVALLGGAGFVVIYLAIVRSSPFLDSFDMRFLVTTLRLGRVPGFESWARGPGKA